MLHILQPHLYPDAVFLRKTISALYDDVCASEFFPILTGPTHPMGCGGPAGV